MNNTSQWDKYCKVTLSCKPGYVTVTMLGYFVMIIISTNNYILGKTEFKDG